MTKPTIKRRSTANVFSALAAGAVLLFLVASPARSQSIVPLERDPAVLQTRSVSSARTHATSMDLPFFDDFSSTQLYDGKTKRSGYPRASHWEIESDNVWVSGGAGINPPSRNVATLDGLDSLGVPYSDQETANGFRDVLVSRPIDLSPAKVTFDERASVFLSFFFQWQGNGEAPDNGDFFRVEFKNSSGVWETIMTISTQSSFRRDVFYDTIRQIQGEQFFHDAFQFRFRNYGRQYGPYDTWNIDYVYLNKGRTALEVGREEGTFASEIGPVFGSYSSVPYEHFKVGPQVTKPQVDVYNLYTLPSGYPMTYNFTADFHQFTGGIKSTQTYSKTDREVKENTTQANMNPYERYRATVSLFPTPGDNNPEITIPFATAFNPAADSMIVTLKLTLDADDTGELAANDTVSASYAMLDYYAYDDGSAEYAVVLNESDDRIAYRFDMLTSEPDRLVGFDVYVPKYSIPGSVTTDFFVIAGANGEPVRDNGVDKVLATRRTTLQRLNRDAFQRINIEPVEVQGQFFIGWRGSATAQLRVGLDYSNNTVDRMYEDSNGTWLPNARLRGGSLMIRPVFGSGGPVIGIPEQVAVSLYPNPSPGRFFVRGDADVTAIYSASGQLVPYDLRRSEGESEVELRRATPGLYVVMLRAAGRNFARKVVVH